MEACEENGCDLDTEEELELMKEMEEYENDDEE